MKLIPLLVTAAALVAAADLLSLLILHEDQFDIYGEEHVGT